MQAEARSSMLKVIFDQVADQLSTQGFSIQKQLFPQELCLRLHEELIELKNNNALSKASIGFQSSKQVRSDIRGDFIHWLDNQSGEEAASNQAWNLLEEIRQELNQQLFLGLKKFEAHFAYYPPGAGYEMHWDNHKGLGQRRITFVLYLNPHWENGQGGELQVHASEPPFRELFKVEPRLGTLILFRSDLFPHQVLTSHRERCSLTGWFRTDL